MCEGVVAFFSEPVELPQPEEEVTKEEIVEPAPAVLPEEEASFDLQALLEQEEQREQREQRKEHRGVKQIICLLIMPIYL